MTSQEPPRLAMSLLARCLPDDPLTGDLIEEFGAGRSRGWFWRQAVSAIASRGSRHVRVGSLVVATMLIGPPIAWVGYAQSFPGHAELPALVRQLTIEEMIRSIRTGDVTTAPRFESSVVDVTGVLDRIVSRSIADAKQTFALYVTSAARLPEVGAMFSLHPSVDVGALTVGDYVTLRCQVLDQQVNLSSCLLVPLP